MSSMLKSKDWKTEARRALGATEIVSSLARLDGWKLTGDGPNVAIEKTYRFANYFETMAFVNAAAWISHREDHHPDMAVGYNQCRVAYITHAIDGLSENDFICAAKLDALFEI